MIPLFAALLAILLGFPKTATPETDAEREERFGNISTAMVTEARTREEIAALTTEVWFESRGDKLIHAGLAHPLWRSDKGKAWCLTQLHLSKLVPDGPSLVGTDLASTRRCIAATLRMLRSASWMCAKKPISGISAARMFAGFGLGHCVPHGQPPPLWALKRAEFFERVRARLWRASIREVQ